MNAIQCDTCKVIANPDAMIAWLKVTWIGTDTLSHGDPPGPFHFDSRKCLTEWALQTAGIRQTQ